MTAFISWLFRLVHGDLYSTARHRLTSAMTGPASTVYVGTRRGWWYRRPDYRWMEVTALWTQIKLRDLTTHTQPLRWYDQEA